MSLEDIQDLKHSTSEVSTDADTPYFWESVQPETFNSVHTVPRKVLDKF